MRFAYSAVKKHYVIRRDVRVVWLCMGLLLCCSSSSQRLVITEEKKWGQNSVRFILSYSLMAWQQRRGHERRAEWKRKEKRNDNTRYGYFTLLHHNSLKVVHWIFLKKTQTADFNSRDEDASVETWKIKGVLIQTEGGKARGAPYLATNYTWSKKREEEEIKTKALLKFLLKHARCTTARAKQGWAWIHLRINRRSQNKTKLNKKSYLEMHQATVGTH